MGVEAGEGGEDKADDGHKDEFKWNEPGAPAADFGGARGAAFGVDDEDD